MHFNDNVETLRLNITDIEALKVRERELERGAQKVNISRIHSGLIEIEIHLIPHIIFTTEKLLK
jgi:phosphopantetheine adenylyltransferase